MWQETYAHRKPGFAGLSVFGTKRCRGNNVRHQADSGVMVGSPQGCRTPDGFVKNDCAVRRAGGGAGGDTGFATPKNANGFYELCLGHEAAIAGLDKKFWKYLRRCRLGVA
jgi:hypothetical protein